MVDTQTVNRRVALNSRLSGAPTAECLRWEERFLPPPSAGELLVQALYVTLDPYMRAG
jgi:NADPH-dependent curcumin reductase